jgi:hypothetical protein
MDELQSFAGHARRFQRWILESQPVGSAAAREALIELTGLYGAALGLPSPFLAKNQTEHAARVDDAEFNRGRTWCARLPFQYYGEVFDPTVVPPEEPVVGDVADDIADVYRDVVTGLRLFDAGLFDDALWEWGFGFRSHWGKHATDAIRAIHHWLASNEPDYLALPRPTSAA